MKRGGVADLPLHHGRVPAWLYERMRNLAGAIIESIVEHYGRREVLRRISDPFWFQSLGAVLGMDWHSSGITTSVLGALKRAVNPIANELGICFCGGRGKHSRNTPNELITRANAKGLDGDALVRASRLAAKIDNTAVQDDFQIYLHSFIVTDEGDWAVVQQGLNDASGMARRYHWHSPTLASFVDEPHASVIGVNQGHIVNLVSHDAAPTRDGVLSIAKENPSRMLDEIRKIVLPRRHEVTKNDVNLKRLGSVLALAYERGTDEFTSLLLTEGLGPRTLQSLVLVSEVIHGTASRFDDPARFSFAHGGKDGHPFPVPTTVYDETIAVLRTALDKARIDRTEKHRALKNLHIAQKRVEALCNPTADFDAVIAKERRESHRYEGKTVFGDAKKETRQPPQSTPRDRQQELPFTEDV